MGRRARSLSFAVMLAASVFYSPAPVGAAVKKTDTGGPAADAALRAYHSGNGLLNRGMYDLAIEEYRTFLTANADHEKAAAARYGLGVCLFRLEKYSEALAELEPLAAQEDFEFAVEVGTMRGRCLLAEGQYDRAAEAFGAVVARDPRGSLAHDAAVGAGEALVHAQRFDDAAEILNSALSGKPDAHLRPRARYFLALAEMGRGRCPEAAEYLDALLRDDADGPFTGHATLLLAQCRHRLGADEEAETLYRRVIDHKSSQFTPDAVYGLSSLLLGRGQSAEAAALLDRLNADDSQRGQHPEWLLLRGRAHYDSADYAAALTCFRRIGGDDPLAAQATYWTARCQLQSDDPAAAAATLASTGDVPAGDELRPLMAYDRAVALLRAEQQEEAAAALRDWLKHHPQHGQAPEATYLLAATEHALGRYDASLAVCNAFLAAHKSHDRASAVAFLAAENELLAGKEESSARLFLRFLRTHADDMRAPLATFRLGMIHYRNQRAEEAEPLLRDVLAGNADDATFLAARLALGDILFQRSEWKTAEEMLAGYLDGGGAEARDDALLKLALARGRQEKFVAALDALQQLLDQFPESPHRTQALFERGQILLAQGELDGAAAAFDTVVAAAPDSPFAAHARNHLGTIALRRNDPARAARRFSEAAAGALDGDAAADALLRTGQAQLAAAQFAEAENSLRRFLTDCGAHPGAATARANLALALSRQDKHEEALKFIEGLSSALGRFDPPLRCALLYERAWCLRQQGRTQDAAAALKMLLAAEPERPHLYALLELADIESQEGHAEEALQLLVRLRAVIERNAEPVPAPVREQATYRLAVARFERGEFEPAAALFVELLAVFPDTTLAASAGYFCGESLLRLGRPAAAADHFRRVFEQHGTDAVCAPSLLRLGEALAQLQRWPASEESFRTYLDRFPESEFAWQARFGYGWACENQQRYDEAVEAYRAVIDAHEGPTAARAQFQIGECLFARRQYDAAVREFLKVDIHYAYPEWSAAALYEAAQCFEQLGKLVEARDHFRRVAEEFKGTRWAEPAAQRLTQLASSSLPGR